VNIIRAHVLVDVDRMMLGGIVVQVLLARLIIESEEALCFSISSQK